MKAPARALVGEPFTAKVTRLLPDGSKEPAEGAAVGGTEADENGEVEVTPEESGGIALRALGGPEDAPSAIVNVCTADVLDDCPKKTGHRDLRIALRR